MCLICESIYINGYMSKRLDFVKGEVASFQNKIEKENELYVRQINTEIERQKNQIEKSGIRDFFEEIINDGSIRLSDSPLIENVISKRWFSDDTKMTSNRLLNFTPARVVYGNADPYKPRYEDGIIQKINDKMLVSISLIFDRRTISDSEEYSVDVHSIIRFVATDKGVCLVGERKDRLGQASTSFEYIPYCHCSDDSLREYEYIPLTSNNHAELVAIGMKRPYIERDNGTSQLTRYDN